jgi:plastocyanin
VGLKILCTAFLCLFGLAAPAAAEEKILTLYSPAIQSQPYVHDTQTVTLAPDGEQAPAEPGYITGWIEQVLVDSKDPDAKPLPQNKMMIHHFLYFAQDNAVQGPGSCWGNAGFIGGRGEEHVSGRYDHYSPPEARQFVGISNRTRDGAAPTWRLTAMVMNHYQRPKQFYVRTKVYYTTEKREPLLPIVIGDCKTLANGMSYDVPGGGGRGSEFVNESDWTVPKGLNGRIVLATSHQHGGAKYHTLGNKTCGQRYFTAPAYHGKPNHIYNTIRPILHEPGPIGNGAYRTMTGIPIREGQVLHRSAVHENQYLHVAAMGFWVVMVLRDDNAPECGPVPSDFVELNKPKEYDKTPNYGLKIPQLAPPPARSFSAMNGNPLKVGDQFFKPGKVTVKAGKPITWSFDGSAEPHSVTVANGPRGFSSRYNGQNSGSYTFTPKVPGTYRLTCLVHPTTMGQTIKVVD